MLAGHLLHPRCRVFVGIVGHGLPEVLEVGVVGALVGRDEEQRDATVAHGSDVILSVIVMSKIYLMMMLTMMTMMIMMMMMMSMVSTVDRPCYVMIMMMMMMMMITIVTAMTMMIIKIIIQTS